MTAPVTPHQALPAVGRIVGWGGRPAEAVGYRSSHGSAITTERRGRIRYVVLRVDGLPGLVDALPREVEPDPSLAGGRIPARLLREGDRIMWGGRTIPVVAVAQTPAGTIVSISDSERVEYPTTAHVLITPRSAA